MSVNSTAEPVLQNVAPAGEVQESLQLKTNGSFAPVQVKAARRGFKSWIPEAQPGASVTTLVPDLPGQQWQDGYTFGKGINAVTGALSAQAIGAFTVTKAKSFNSNTTYSNISSTSSVDDQIDVSAKGSYNMGGVELSASASFIYNIKQSQLDMTILATYEVAYNDYDAIDISSVKFSQQAQALIDAGNFTEFRNLYGDYYIAGAKRYAYFRAIYTISAQTEEALLDVKTAFGASAPEMFTAEGQAEFKKATTSSNVSVNFICQMIGQSPNPKQPEPAGPITMETVMTFLTWFQQNNSPVAVQAEMIHYSQINNKIPNTLPIDPNIFSSVGTIYFDTFLLQITYNSLPAVWQSNYQVQVKALVNNVKANAESLVGNPTEISSLSTQLNTLLDTLNNMYQRYQFILSIIADQANEPGVGTSMSGTISYGSNQYPNAANDPAFLIQSTSQNYAESGHIGHKTHDFNVGAPNGKIVQWEVHQIWADGTDGTWSKNAQDNNSSYILMNDSANIHCRSEYDRGFDNTIWIWYVDNSLIPPYLS